MTKTIRSFLGFWYGFIVGDDWTVAAVIGVAIAVIAALHQRGVEAGWLLPLTVAGATAASLWRVRGPAVRP